MTELLGALAGYLAGSIPFAVLVSRALRLPDPRTYGSGNIGATNVGRLLGFRWGALVFLLDFAKGALPVFLAGLLPPPEEFLPHTLPVTAGVAAFLGHLFPVYLGFRGGKGVATTIGVAIGVWPYYTIAMATALVAYAIGRFTTGAVSVGSLALAGIFPIALLVALRIRGEAMAPHWPLVAVAAALSLVIIVRHRENIQRLLAGREMKTGSPSQPT